MGGGSGSAGGGGYNLQARMIALVGVHILSGEPLAWLEMKDCQDIPCAISAETGGPGDDFRVELLQTNLTFEVQAKRGLNADIRLYETIDHFVKGLESDPLVHCILAIDPTASSPIRTHLLEDLQRLRQGREDSFHKITQEVMRRIAEKGLHPARELAKRISLHIFDIERRSANDSFYALLLLRRILADPDQAEAAWSTLVDDALQLIQHRGRRDAHTLGGLLRSNRIHLANTTLSTVLPKYLRWLEEMTATFLVPGLGVRLPIEEAWIHLQVLGDQVEMTRPSTLEAKIASYHEWERLSYREHAYSAQDVTEFGHRVVVIGGPGAGKSTLCQRTVHRLARSGKCVLHVRLSSVAQRCFIGGESIDESILSVATAGSGIQPAMLMNILNEPDCLLADGLDECGAYCSAMAEQLRLWAAARPHTRVVVTTRAIGYDRASFEDWQHVELLPLDLNHVEDYARSILKHIEADLPTLARKIQLFQSQIKTNRIASMAVRNPLLLGFLVQLTHHHIPFAQHRAALFEQVLALWYKTPSKGRNITTPVPSASFAHEVLNRVGRHLQQPSLLPSARSKQGIIDALAPQLRDHEQSLLAVKEKIEHCLIFWQERGVLELLQVGHEEAYTFVYASLGEYAAARYIASWNDHEIYTFLERVRHDAQWRETLLFTSGAGKANVIAEYLLALDRENDPIATESLLAAAALAETAQPSPDLALRVAERIRDRLCSTVPVIAYESIQHSVGLAAQLGEQMKPLLHPLARHPQLWTRLTALRLSLAAGDAVVDFDALEACLEEWIAPKDAPEPGETASPQTTQALREYLLGRREPWHTGNEVLALGAEALVRARPSEATAKRLERLARMENGVSMHTTMVLLHQLNQLGYADVAAQIAEEQTTPLRDIHWDSIRNQYRQADTALLEAVLRVTNSAPSKEQHQRHPLALSMLIHALQLPKLGVSDWLVLGEYREIAALDVVLTGTIAALDLDHTEVAADANWALTNIMDTTQTRYADTSLLSILPEIPVEPDWRRAVEAKLSPPDLVRALRHPSNAIAFGAAQLLAAGVGGNDAAHVLEGVLEQGDDFALQLVALIADSVWGKEALAKVLARLNKPLSRGCRWLLKELPRISEGRSDEQIREMLVRSLTAEDPQIAIAVAETLQSLPEAFLKPDITHLQAAFDEWSARGDYCEHHQCYVHGVCCEYRPLCPRAQILKLLARFSVVTLPELLEACHDPHRDIRKFAAQEVAHVLTSHSEEIATVLNDVANGHHPPTVLEAILSMPATALMSSREVLLKLFSAESAVLRRIMVRNAATAAWLTKEEAINAAQTALEDSDLTVRNLAISTLCSLKLIN